MRSFDPFTVPLNGRHLVEASAGTGKTYNITSLFIRYLIETGAEVDRILVLTYTKAATAELKKRILDRIREAIAALDAGEAHAADEFLGQLLDWTDNPAEAISSLERAMRNFDEASIFTIHGFCQRALQEQSFLSGMVYGSEVVSDDAELITDAADDYWRSLVNRANASETGRIWLHILREEGYTPETLISLISPGIGKPYLNLVAEQPPGEDREAELRELTRIHGELRAAWAEDRSEIEQLLLSDVMNGNRYPRASVPVWTEAMERWLYREYPSLSVPEKFDRFSYRFIQSNGVRKGMESPEHPFFHGVDDYLRQAERVRAWLPEFKKELLQHTRKTVRSRKLERGIIGYDDMLVLLNEALKRSGEGERLARFLRDKYPIALVDEFQDTDPVQYEILSRVYRAAHEESGLFLIGDPKQSIYSFRGADLFSYLEARSEISDGEQYSLGRNFRSEPTLIESVNAVFSRLEAPFLVENIEFESAEPGHITVEPMLIGGERRPPLRFLQSESADPGDPVYKGTARARAAEVTAESIARLLNRDTDPPVTIDGEPVRARDIAVLVRKHSQAERVRQALEKRGIKSVQYSQKSVFESEEAADMQRLLEAVAEPGNGRLVRAALTTELFPHTAGDILRLMDGEQQWNELAGKFDHWHQIWQERGFIPMFRTFLNDSGVEEQLASSRNGERKLSNTLQLGELLQKRSKDGNGGMFELIRWLGYKRKEPDENAEDEQLRLESDRALVKLVTMHRSKGLEYPVVYCPYLWDGRQFTDSGTPFIFHDPDRGYSASLDLNEKGHPEREKHRYQAALEEVSENLRLAYVAMTRAMQHCTIVYEPVRGMEYSALGYLLLGKEPVEEQLESKIRSDKSTSRLSAEPFHRAMIGLAESHAGLISHESLNETEHTYHRAEADIGKPESLPRSLPEGREIHSRFIQSSFSSIMHPSTAESDADIPSDEFFLPEEYQAVDEPVDRSIFSFPKGPRAGNCVHSIFEEIQFDGDQDRSRIIEQNLERFGFDAEWLPVVDRMVQTVLETELREGITLGHVSPGQLVREMEFYFDLQPFQREEMFRRIRKGTDREVDRYPYLAVPEGYMKGYIDLVFEWDGRYFILDYK
ncbi:MAG: exodeoxyribonuclease V subunit beta, partial [Balneolaceae bacterium]|nr:exodeoxyribonuclease V subunit beta [Balneolaceae bacterium]